MDSAASINVSIYWFDRVHYVVAIILKFGLYNGTHKILLSLQ